MAAYLEQDPLLRSGRALPGCCARKGGSWCSCMTRVDLQPYLQGSMLLVSLSASVSGLSFGYEVGIIDTVLQMDTFRGWAGTTADNPDTSHTTGWIVSAFLFGAIAGSVCVSYLADAVGRRMSLMIGALLFTIGGSAQAATGSLTGLYLSRGLSGCAIGILSMVAPLYISECAPSGIRGSLIAVQQLLITVGILIASCVNSVLYSLGEGLGDMQWRLALAAQAVPGVLLFVLMLRMPPSPRWLMKRGREQEALTVLRTLRGTSSGMEADTPVLAEVAEIKAAIVAEGDADDSSAWLDLFRQPSVRWRLFLACALQIAQQFTLINVELYYFGDLASRIGVDERHASTTLVIVNSTLLVLGTIPGMILVEHASYGRRALLIYGGIAMAIAHAALCACVTVANTSSGVTTVALSWLAVLAMYTFTVSFSATWGPVVWVYQNEVLPLRLRARGTAVATVMNWSSNALIGKLAPLSLDAVSFYTYALGAALAVAMTVFVWAYVPETQGVTLEGMETLFNARAKGATYSPPHASDDPHQVDHVSDAHGLLAAAVDRIHDVGNVSVREEHDDDGDADAIREIAAALLAKARLSQLTSSFRSCHGAHHHSGGGQHIRPDAGTDGADQCQRQDGRRRFRQDAGDGVQYQDSVHWRHGEGAA